MYPRDITPRALPLSGWGFGPTMHVNGTPGGGIALVEFEVQRGSEPPLHRHRHEELGIHVLEGDVTFHIAGSHVPATSGDWVVVPRGTEHGYTIGSERARLLVALTPSGAERYLTELHDPQRLATGAADDGASGSLEHLIATAARYGIEITGPRPSEVKQGR